MYIVACRYITFEFSNVPAASCATVFTPSPAPIVCPEISDWKFAGEYGNEPPDALSA